MSTRCLKIAVLAAALVAAAGVASAQLANQAVPTLDKVGVEEHLDARLPLELEFIDEAGRTVRLGDYFDGARPVILTLNYYRCPMLCGLQLNGVVAGMEEMDWTPGVEFEMVTVSIDPLETPELAQAKKENYLKRYQRPAAARGWHFLTGRQDNIERLAETVGFGYTYDVASGQYAHAAAIFVITPDGRRLYFSSDRRAPGPVDASGMPMLNIWYVERELEKLHVATRGKFARDALNLDRPAGTLSLTADYALDLSGEQPEVTVSNLALALSGLLRKLHGSETAFLELPVGRTSITVDVEVYATRNPHEEVTVKVTEATLTYVAVGPDRRPRELVPG